MADIPIENPNTDLLSTEVDTMMNAFWLEVRENIPMFSTPPAEIIHHYTSVKSAISIIENQTLWSSNIAYLNDAHELVTAKNILNYIHQHPENWSYKDTPLAIELLDNLISEIDTRFVHASFVISFCNTGDHLGQWRGYGGGVSIAFNSATLNRSFDNTTLYDVIYEANTQAEIFDTLLRTVGQWLQEKENHVNYNQFKETAVNNLREYFEHLAAQMKNYAFREENELRLVTARPDIPLANHPEVHYREENGAITPHLKLGLNDTPLPIVGVTLAPNCHHSVEFALGSLLIKHGYPADILQKSEIPYRN